MHCQEVVDPAHELDAAARVEWIRISPATDFESSTSMGSRDVSLYFTHMVVLLTATTEQEGVAPASKTTVRTACRSVYHFDADIQLRWRKT